MKIVIATPFYPPEIGVLANYSASLEESFRRKGHETSVVSLGSLGQLPAGIRHIAYFFRMFSALKGASFALSLDMWSVGAPAYAAARLRGIRFVTRIGGDTLYESYVDRTRETVRLSEFYEREHAFSFKERLMRRVFGSMLRGAHAVFFNTNFQKSIWEKAFRIPAGKARLLENFFPEKRGEAPAPNRVFVGANRGAHFKNAERLKAAFSRVKARHPLIELDERMLPHDKQLERLAASYAAIIPSISEVASNIAIESVSCGRPFIMTGDTGIKERLGECGLFVDTRSEVAIENAIESLLEPHVYDRLAARVRAFSFTRSWDDIAADILAAVQ